MKTIIVPAQEIVESQECKTLNWTNLGWKGNNYFISTFLHLVPFDDIWTHEPPETKQFINKQII